MSAQIIAFSARKSDAERLVIVGDILSNVILLPAHDMELDLLLKIGSKLLDNLNDYTRPNCSGLMDSWLDRLDQLEARIAG